ncbi:MAG: CoA transferase, partial [Candidatus Binataceae bacterium]
REAIACEPVQTYAAAACDPHVLARDMMQPTAQEGGATAPIVGPAAKFSRTPTRVRTGSAALGAHNEEILEALGIDAAARKRLKADGII